MSEQSRDEASTPTTLNLPGAKSYTRRTAEVLAAEIAGSPHPVNFSGPAAEEFWGQVAEMSRSMGVDAIRLARAERADYVSKKHITAAADRIFTARHSRHQEILLMIGGVVSGAAAQGILDAGVTGEGPISQLEFLTVVGVTLLGITLLVLGFSRHGSR